jgi:hypothetical protein
MTPQERARTSALKNDCILQVDIGEDDLDDDLMSVSASMTTSMTASMQRSIHSDNDWYTLDTPKIRGSVSPGSML